MIIKTLKNRITVIPSGKLLIKQSEYLYVPSNAVEKICGYTNDELKRFKLLKVLQVIQSKQALDKLFQINEYVEIPKRKFESFLGKYYARDLELLEDKLEIIEKFRSSDGRESYSAKSDKYRKTFCKKFRFKKSPKKFQKIVYKNSEVLIENRTKENTVITPNGEWDDAWISWNNFESRLTLDLSGLNEVEDRYFGLYGEYLNYFNNGASMPERNLNSTRFYCESVMMPNCFKKYLLLDGVRDKILNYDMVNAFFRNLAEILGIDLKVAGIGIGERGREGGAGDHHMCRPPTSPDIYKQLQRDTGLSRYIIKEEVNRYMNSKCGKFRGSHPFNQKLRELGLERMAEYIFKTDEVWRELDAFETKIMVVITRALISKGINIVRAHDGFLCAKVDEVAIDEVIRKVLVDYKNIEFKKSEMSEVKERTSPICVEMIPTTDRVAKIAVTLKILRNFNHSKKDKVIGTIIGGLEKIHAREARIEQERMASGMETDNVKEKLKVESNRQIEDFGVNHKNAA